MLLRNDGGWRFNDVTETVGLGHNNNRFSFAAAWEDYDDDGDVDVLVVNLNDSPTLLRNDYSRARHRISVKLIGARIGDGTGVTIRAMLGTHVMTRSVRVASSYMSYSDTRVFFGLDREDEVDVLITEVGGTVGDIEILPFLEAVRQFRLDVGDQNVCYVHVTLVPYIGPSGEHKTKPTQHSVTELRASGIQPHAIVCRSDEPISDDLERKISRLSNVPFEGVVNAPDADSLYEIPLIIHDDGLDVYLCNTLGLETSQPDLGEWRARVDRAVDASTVVRVGLIGKYVSLVDAYLSVVEALTHAGAHHGAQVEIDWIPDRTANG